MINITKSWLFEEIKKKKINRSLVRLTKKKRKDPKTKVSIERGEITTHTIEIPSKSYPEYYQQLNINKLENLEAKDKILEIYSLPRPKKRRNR